ncbi:hypothetical protein PRZ48_011901 [Zasmidium cellare]|uniref:F-box domain-containing protein n=1 Tax=Zasmidium cellare TaxID=395010 RepID=A0ABR0E7N0_ZASCE|nr:hypothetical protein PRZ48_011901 [Zasmidium cellare]
MLSALTTYAKSWIPTTGSSEAERTMKDSETPAALGLPNEVLMRIFSLLPKRQDVAACRLVCRDFKELSSPFLITRIVVAKRLDTMEKFYDVMEHPYFRKHVTELIYDASWYDHMLARDPMAYADARMSEQREERLSDVKAQTRQYVDLWDRALRGFTTTARPRELLEDMDDNSELSWKMVTYHDYSMRCGHQLRMLSTGMPSYAIKAAFHNFPRLRHVVFGDYRNIAKDEESYSECCARLFGDTLEPYGLNVDPNADYMTAGMAIDEVDQPDPFDELIELASVLHSVDQRTRSRFRTFSIGGHAFMRLPGGPQGIMLREGDIQGNPGIPLNLGEDAEPEIDSLDFKGFEGVQHLALPVEVYEPKFDLNPDDERENMQYICFGAGFVRPMLQHAAPTLTHLELSATKLSVRNNEAVTILQKLFFDLDFPTLRHLDLRGWVLQADPTTAFLSKVSTTLKELRLICNVVFDPAKLAQWGGENLCLDGVQIYNYDHGVVGVEEDALDEHASLVHEGQWLAGRQNYLAKVPVATGQTAPGRIVEEL